MFEIGFGEILVILLVALVVLGPEQLPEVTRTLLRYLRAFRRWSQGVRAQVRGIIDEEDSLRELHQEWTASKGMIRDQYGQLQQTFDVLDLEEKPAPPSVSAPKEPKP